MGAKGLAPGGRQRVKMLNWRQIPILVQSQRAPAMDTGTFGYSYVFFKYVYSLQQREGSLVRPLGGHRTPSVDALRRPQAFLTHGMSLKDRTQAYNGPGGPRAGA